MAGADSLPQASSQNFIDLTKKPDKLTKSIVRLTSSETQKQTQAHLVSSLQAQFDIEGDDDISILEQARDKIATILADGNSTKGRLTDPTTESEEYYAQQSKIRRILKPHIDDIKGVFAEDKDFFRTTQEVRNEVKQTTEYAKTPNQKFEGKHLRDLTAANAMSGSFHYGTSMFLGVKAFRQPDGKMKLFRIKDQIERLRSGCRALGFGELEYNDQELEEAMQRSADKAAGEFGAPGSVDSVYIRPFARADVKNLGITGKGMQKHVDLIFEGEYFDYLGKDQKLFMPDDESTQRNEPNPADKLSAQYDKIRKVGDNLDTTKYTGGLLLDKYGFIGEMAANIFFIKPDGKTIVTPKLGEILPGFTRDSMIKILREEGYEVEERNIGPNELKDFSGCFTTGTASGAKKVVSITHKDETSEFDQDHDIVAKVQGIYENIATGQFDKLGDKADMYREMAKDW